MKPIIDITLTPPQRVGAGVEDRFVAVDSILRPLDIELLSEGDYYKLLYCRRGTISGYLNSVYVEVSPASLLFIAPGDSFHCFDDSEPEALFAVVIFSKDYLGEQGRDAINQLKSVAIGHMALLPREGAQFEDSFNIICRRKSEKPLLISNILSSYLTILLCDIVSFFVREEGSASFSKPKRLCLRFCKLLHQCQAKEKLLSYYATELDVSPNHLSYVCGEVLGYSAGRYIDEAVALRSRSLLLFTDMSVADISRHMGFTNQSFFGKFFKRRFGVSPLNYRQRYIIRYKKR